MPSSGKNDGELLVKVLNLVSLAVLSGYLTVEYVVPYLKKKNWFGLGSSQTKSILDKLGMKGLNLSSYEADLLSGVMLPEDIDYSLEDIGGLEEQKRELIKNLAFGRFNRSSSSLERLISSPTGILLYGPPGCGKTMLAKALAKHSSMRFLCVQLSQLLDKWVGESEKYVQAAFSLAQKLQPCIVFLDEIDALTRQRASGEREWSGMVKSQMLALWGECEGVVVLGATNRREDIDEAFLRRMPLQLHVGLPDLEARVGIFRAILETRLTRVEMEELAGNTEGLSGCDIREVCRRAALDCLESGREEMEIKDIFHAILQVKCTKYIKIA